MGVTNVASNSTGVRTPLSQLLSGPPLYILLFAVALEVVFWVFDVQVQFVEVWIVALVVPLALSLTKPAADASSKLPTKKMVHEDSRPRDLQRKPAQVVPGRKGATERTPPTQSPADIDRTAQKARIDTAIKEGKLQEAEAVLTGLMEANNADAQAKPAAGAASAKGIFGVLKRIIVGSFLVQFGYAAPALGKTLKAKKAAETKKEEKEGEEKTNEDGSILKGLTMFNVLGLGLATTKESWTLLKGLQVEPPAKSKKGSPFQERVGANFERNMPQYIHILFALMCVRALLFRSLFACLPWLVVYQIACLHFDVIKAKFPQVPPVDFEIRVLVTGTLHALAWLFFFYEYVAMTHILEKMFLGALFVAHAYVVVPTEKRED